MVLDKNKKRVTEVVSARNLTSIMNNTKWEELQNAVLDDLLFPPPFQAKYVLDDRIYRGNFESDVRYWGDWVEGLEPFYSVEWIRVRPRYLKHRGRLVSPELIDITEDFTKILMGLSIPYRLENDTFYIYGYTSDPSSLIISRESDKHDN
ncbi:DUF6678 family protein [Paenibacillus marinisediminis]